MKVIIYLNFEELDKVLEHECLKLIVYNSINIVLPQKYLSTTFIPVHIKNKTGFSANEIDLMMTSMSEIYNIHKKFKTSFIFDSVFLSMILNLYKFKVNYTILQSFAF